MNKKEVLEKLDEQFNLSLNGQWSKFTKALEHLRYEVDEMTTEDIQSLKKTVCNSIDKKCNVMK